MFSPSPQDIRVFFGQAWRDHLAGKPVDGLPLLAAQIIADHPEYHALLTDPNLPADAGYTEAHNPFLHLSLHLALAEQLSIDHPHGIIGEYRRLMEKYGDRHNTEHAVMACLAEVVHNATFARQPPDNDAYINCLKDL